MDFELWWFIIAVAGGAVLSALLLLYNTRAEKRKKEPLEREDVRQAWPPLETERTVSPNEAEKARGELKTLDLEREILSYAIRRLYEAEAEGKISEEEKEQLAHRYKERMMEIKELISRSESLVALHELEAMQEDLVKLFSDRFDEVNRKIGELRTRLEVKTVEEVPTPSPAPSESLPATEKRKKSKKPQVPAPTAPGKTEAEKKIAEIKAEVEKVLERLEQIEVET